MAKCPYCKATLLSLNVEMIFSTAPNEEEYETAVFTCPYCQKIISTQIDPIVIKEEIKETIEKKRH